MPEGDTVFTAAKRLDAALTGRVLTGCDIRVPAFATVDLTGEIVHSVASRGKHLLIRVGESSIHSHLKMEGVWQVYAPGQKWRRPAFKARAILSTANATAVGFELGMLEVIPTEREDEMLGYLGPDLLGADWDAQRAVINVARDPDVPIAVALLDQRNLAGLGNEYVTELCFLRGMLPTRPVGSVDLTRTIELGHRLIVTNRDRVDRTFTGNTRRGETDWVHRREGLPCRRCGTTIETGRLGRTDLQLRDTWWCPRCQT